MRHMTSCVAEVLPPLLFCLSDVFAVCVRSSYVSAFSSPTKNAMLMGDRSNHDETQLVGILNRIEPNGYLAFFI